MNLNFSIADRSHSKRALLLASAGVALLTFIVYLGSLSGDFINYDDKAYLFENPVIKQLDMGTVISMFTRSHAGWWMPLTWLSFAVDYQLWGLNPVGFHLVNSLIHSVNAALVTVIAAQLMTVSRTTAYRPWQYILTAVFGGMLWSLHPLRVESVAWIAERKDVLNGLFALSAVFFYLRGQIRAADGRDPGRSLLWSVLCFYLSLGAKSVTVVLPLMLLALDLYPLKRLTVNSISARIFEKSAYFAGSAVVILATFAAAAQSNFLVSYEMFPFSQRLAVSGNAILKYLQLFVFPVGLSPLNVIPDPIPSAYTVKALVALAIIIGVLLSRKVWLQSCFLCFLVPFLPVLAFFQNGDQAFADHFTYLPAIAPSIAAAVLLGSFTAGRGATVQLAALAAAGIMVVSCAFLSMGMFPVWRSTESFWTRVIRIQPIAINYKERGRNYHLDGRYKEAIADFSAAIALMPETLRPYSYNFYAFRAESLRCAGLYAEALRDFDTAIAMLPHPVYYQHRGLTMKALGRFSEAELDFSRGGTVTYPIVWFDRVL